MTEEQRQAAIAAVIAECGDNLAPFNVAQVAWRTWVDGRPLTITGPNGIGYDALFVSVERVRAERRMAKSTAVIERAREIIAEQETAI